MAFIERPRLLMIDELSLGLAPDDRRAAAADRARHRRAGHDDHPRRAVGEPRARRSPRRAYFMEKGEIRFNGPTAELLERPDVLRSVFLEGAAKGIEAGAEAAIPTVPPTTAHVDRAARATATARRPVRLELDGVSKRFGGLAALTDVSLRRAPRARSSASSARTARARRRSST